MDKNTLKNYFLTGKRPTQEQFAELIDSLLHIDDKIKISNVKNLCVILDGKQDCISDLLKTTDKSIVGAINELEAKKVNLYRERVITIVPESQKYAKILSVKPGSFSLDFEVNEYPSDCYGSNSWDTNRISGKYNDRLMISAGHEKSSAYTLRTKDLAYTTRPEDGYTDVYIKTDGDLAKTLSLRLSFVTNEAEDAVVYYEHPDYMMWDNIPGVPAVVASCGSGLIEVTYLELKGLLETGSLQKGASYLITDFQTVYTQPVTNMQKEGEIEPLIVFAASENQLGAEAVSTLHPSDVIHYDATGENCSWNMEGSSKGQIIYRKDTRLNNECHYDFRAIKFVRVKTDFSEVLDWDGDNHTYNEGNLVKYEDRIYICTGAHSSAQEGILSIKESVYWTTISSGSYYTIEDYFGRVNLPYIDEKIELETFNSTCISNSISKYFDSQYHRLNDVVLINSTKNKIDGHGHNLTLENCHRNTLGIDCRNLTMKNADTNTIREGNSSCTIVDSSGNDTGSNVSSCFIYKLLYSSIGSECRDCNFYNCILIDTGTRSQGNSFSNSFFIKIGREMSGNKFLKCSKISVEEQGNNNTFNNSHFITLGKECSANTFTKSSWSELGSGSGNNIFSKSNNNTLGALCSWNTFEECSDFNVMTTKVTGNKLSDSQYNIFHQCADNNTLRDNAERNTFMQHASQNTLIGNAKDLSIPTTQNCIIGVFSTGNQLEKAKNCKIGNSSYNNTFYWASNCEIANESGYNHLSGHANSIGNFCNSNTIGAGNPETQDDSSNNHIGNSSYGNTIVDSYRNRIGEYSSNNSLTNCLNIKIGNDCSENTFTTCCDSELKIKCSNNLFQDCKSNVFGTDCYANELTASHFNTFKSECTQNALFFSNRIEFDSSVHKFKMVSSERSKIESDNTGCRGSFDKNDVTTGYFKLVGVTIKSGTHLQLDKLGISVLEDGCPTSNYYRLSDNSSGEFLGKKWRYFRSYSQFRDGNTYIDKIAETVLVDNTETQFGNNYKEELVV